MKATYRHDNKNKKVLFFAVVFFVLIFVLLFGPVRTVVSGVIYKVAPSLWNGGAYVSDRWQRVLGGFQNSSNLSVENKLLQEQIVSLQAQSIDRDLLLQEVARLDASAGRSVEKNAVSGRVLSFPRQSPYDIMVVDVGTDRGVKTGDRVLGASLGVIGEVAEVYASSAKIKLFSSPGKELSVLVGDMAIPTVAHGRGMGNFEAKIPQGSNVFVGENVFLPGGKFVVGVVGSTEESPTLPFIRVFFRTPFNVSELRFVNIVTSKPVTK